jgi:hypothetical protein
MVTILPEGGGAMLAGGHCPLPGRKADHLTMAPDKCGAGCAGGYGRYWIARWVTAEDFYVALCEPLRYANLVIDGES